MRHADRLREGREADNRDQQPCDQSDPGQTPLWIPSFEPCDSRFKPIQFNGSKKQDPQSSNQNTPSPNLLKLVGRQQQGVAAKRLPRGTRGVPPAAPWLLVGFRVQAGLLSEASFPLARHFWPIAKETERPPILTSPAARHHHIQLRRPGSGRTKSNRLVPDQL